MKAFTDRLISLTEMRIIYGQYGNSLNDQMSRYGNKIATGILTLPQLQLLKKNYQTLIAVLNEQLNPDINNFSLHLILTVSSGYLKLNKIDQAKQILKKSFVYAEGGTNIDPLLLVSCLNNLANIQKLKGKKHKSLKYSLKALEIMQGHMDALRQRKDKQKIREDAIVFLIVVIRCKSTLNALLVSQPNHRYFRKAYELMNYLGYRSCLKYLGEGSVFIKRFVPVQRQFHLPIFKTYKTESKGERRHEHQNQKLILEQLGKIHDILKSKQNPDVIVVNTQSYIQDGQQIQLSHQEQVVNISQHIQRARSPQLLPKPISAKERPPPSPKINPKVVEKITEPEPEKIAELEVQSLPHHEPEEDKNVSLSEQLQKLESIQKQSSLKIDAVEQKDPTPQYIPSESQSQESQQQVAESTIFIDNWQLHIRHQKSKSNPIGTLHIQSFRLSTNKKKKQSKIQQINSEKLQKLLSQLNYQDKLPYQLFKQELAQQEFIEHNVKPYLSVSMDGVVSYRPRAVGLLNPFVMKIFSQDSLVFFNHIRNNMFRIAISPFYAFKSTYLNVEFASQSKQKYFSFQDEVNDFLTAIYKGIVTSQTSTRGIPQSVKTKNKHCKIKDGQGLRLYIQQIIIQFENILLNREDQTSVNQILQNQLFFYKYREGHGTKKGVYSIIRYLPGINCSDIYLQNNYLTYSPEGKTKARGNILYKSRDFFRQFGVPLRLSYAKKKLPAYLEIISRKYTLMTFEFPLNQSDLDAYVENALLQFPITENCFKTNIYEAETNCRALTISLLTVNNQFPIGIKVTDYNPETVLSRGFFIHIVPQEWARPLRESAPWVNKTLFKTFISEFGFRRDYFIGEWLEKKGFELMLECILDINHPLHLQKNINCFLRSQVIFQLFNQHSKDNLS